MRLISFAVVSLLAVTVSAYPGPGTPHQSTTTQSALQHQSTDTPGAQQHQGNDDLNDPDLRSAIAQSLQQQQTDDDLNDQQLQLALAESAQQPQSNRDQILQDYGQGASQAEVKELEEELKLKEALAAELKDVIDAIKNEELQTGSEINLINSNLKREGISQEEQMHLLKENFSKTTSMSEAYSSMKTIQRELESVKAECEIIKAKIFSLSGF
ncbi:hypothetical protein BASA60_001896 [Batrachochytrium salamandrivorans]|nr:hypothetical protein BASA60_001896 [Batrachochytrium salamandrivorans]